MANKSLARCMGGSRCNHTPGKCTATNAEYQKAQIEARRPPATQAGDALVDAVAYQIIQGSAGYKAAEHAKEFQTADWTEARDSARSVVPIIHRETAAAHAAGVVEERAKVVAWLRRCGEGRPTNSDDHIAAASAFTVSADAIERGQHKETGDADQV